jgi:hypothetical protein
MAERIHIVLDRAEKEQFQRRADREGKSLSAWLRDAAREKLATEEARQTLDSEESLQAFFRECDTREHGKEPDWPAHRRVIEKSVRSGAAEP